MVQFRMTEKELISRHKFTWERLWESLWVKMSLLSQSVRTDDTREEGRCRYRAVERLRVRRQKSKPDERTAHEICCVRLQRTTVSCEAGLRRATGHYRTKERSNFVSSGVLSLLEWRPFMAQQSDTLALVERVVSSESGSQCASSPLGSSK